MEFWGNKRITPQRQRLSELEPNDSYEYEQQISVDKIVKCLNFQYN